MAAQSRRRHMDFRATARTVFVALNLLTSRLLTDPRSIDAELGMKLMSSVNFSISNMAGGDDVLPL